MKKKIKLMIALALIVIVIVCSTLGCNASNTKDTTTTTTTTIVAEASENNFGFEEIYTEPRYSIYVYREISTDVMYCTYSEIVAYGGLGGLTVMMDPQTGGPLTYENWVANYKNK